jgi:hypothetical protein
MPIEESPTSSGERIVQPAGAVAVRRSRHFSRRKAARRLTIAFYILLVLLNFAVLSLFGPGGLAGDVVRFLERYHRTAPLVAPLEPGQYPPGENWDNGDPPHVSAGPR